MAMTDLGIIGRSLRVRLFSTTVTIITVAIAVALMLVLLSMRDAGRQAFARGSGNMHLLVTADNSPLTSVLNGVFYANAPSRAIPWRRYTQISEDPRIAWAIPTAQGDSFRGYPVVATTTDFFAKFQPHARENWACAQGRFFDKPFEVVLGARVAQEVGLKIGDRLAVAHGRSDAKAGAILPPASKNEDDHEHDHADHDHDHGDEHTEASGGAHVHTEFAFEVVGILAPTASPHDRALFIDLNSTWMVHAHDRRETQARASKQAGEVSKTTEADLIDADRLVTGIAVRCVTREGSDSSVVMPQVAAELRKDATIVVASPTTEIDKLFSIVGNIDRILIAMAGVVMLSSGIGILLALYNSMSERKRQIAILRVLGSSASRVFFLVLTESVLIGLVGAIIGVGLAFAGAKLVSTALRTTLGLDVSPSLTPEWILGLVGGTLILASIAGLIPAFMAYRTNIVRGLRPAA